MSKVTTFLPLGFGAVMVRRFDGGQKTEDGGQKTEDGGNIEYRTRNIEWRSEGGI